jgi:hypothetical protein
MELRAHWAVHGVDATLRPYGPYRTWPPKPIIEESKAEIPGAPAREAMKGCTWIQSPAKILLPCQPEGSPRDPAVNPNSEI